MKLIKLYTNKFIQINSNKLISLIIEIYTGVNKFLFGQIIINKALFFKFYTNTSFKLS